MLSIREEKLNRILATEASALPKKRTEIEIDMGVYTALDNPLVDQTVENHLNQIVDAICSSVRPTSIILRGSFSAGEGSIVIEDGRLRFLSDYELMVITSRVQDRQRLRITARNLTSRLGVMTSITWLPLKSWWHETRNFPQTISSYEVQNNGLALYGEHVLKKAGVIDPGTINRWSALRLLFNRMAESLGCPSPGADWEGLRMITKTALACAEALLVVSGQYHYSYAERGRRFAWLALQPDVVMTQSKELPDLIRRATAFKLRPALDSYGAPVPAVWQHIKRACDISFRHVIAVYLGITFDGYEEFPELYRRQLLRQNKLRQKYLPSLPVPLSQNAFLFLRFLHDQHRLPLRLIARSTFPAPQSVYSVVPLMFLGGGEAVLTEARRQLEKVIHLQPRHSDIQDEREYLQSRTLHAWNDFCYGLWEVI